MMTERKCHCLCFVRLLSFLALLQGTTDAYLTASMAECDTRLPPFRLNGSENSNAIVFSLGGVASSSREPCRVTVLVNPDHVMSLHVVKPAARLAPARDAPRVPCFLKLFSVQYAPILEKDLCSPLLEYETEIIISHKVVLVWSPPPAEVSDHLHATEIVVSAVGRGTGVCSSQSNHWCQKRLRKDILCVASELMCDGYRNCPGGGDEHPALCILRGTKTLPRAAEPWENSRQEHESTYTTIQKILAAIRRSRPADLPASTAQPEDVFMNEDDVPDSIPEILAYYSPWGYLMLGMLITGTVLLLCGLWECFCRRPRPSSIVGRGVTSSALFIINDDMEVPPHPPTPDPPAYEELDQPPPYDSLFPITKVTTVTEQEVT